jgi:lysophospholipase L1-like esterase
MKPLALLAALAALLLIAAPASAASKAKYVVSLGDSFSAGVQPGPGQSKSYSYPKVSYAQQMISRASKLMKTPLQLEMLACGGATTQSMPGVQVKQCDPGVGGFKLPYANTGPRTSQLAYALKFLRQHRGQVGFVTMTMGGNNLLKCVDASTGGFDINCIQASYGEISDQLPTIAKQLKQAAGPGVPLLGIGYYDPYLQFYLRGQAQQAIAQASLPIAAQLNSTMQTAYQSAGWKWVGVENVFDTNVPLDQTTNLDPYGQVPVAVAMVCEMSWMCAPAPQGPNIHPNQAGYAAYASAALGVLKKSVR